MDYNRNLDPDQEYKDKEMNYLKSKRNQSPFFLWITGQISKDEFDKRELKIKVN